MQLFKTLEEQLKKEPNFVTDDGELKKWVVLDKARNIDEELITLLLEDDELKTKFFKKIKGVLVFDQNLFLSFLEQKNYLNDSYTQYKNKIGLTIDGKYLKQRNEVALAWAFKDCVLEGGQSRDEDRREEIFFNEILAQDEITQLLEPKVLTNAKRYDAKGEHGFDKFNRNETGTITDNLIIKGNNLLALHSIKREFGGKVKLIYIDPPYNTGEDSFNYNDSFNHSSWLTFVKNRLEIAKELLTKDGAIFIQIDDNEQAYLKVLADEIFGRENSVSTIVWQKRTSPDARATLGAAHDSILVFAKNVSSFKLNPLELTDQQKEAYKNPDNDPRGAWVSTDFTGMTGHATPNQYYTIVSPSGNKFPPPPGRCWALAERTFYDLVKQDRVWFGRDGNSRPRLKRYLSEAIGQNTWGWWTKEDVGHNQEAKKESVALFGADFSFGTPKPERLLQRVLQIATDEGDLVLDFFAGSGTTGAVAHKMKRQFILIEQMDYIQKFTFPRLVKVIEGEQGGISKVENWRGGGEFTYLELKRYNQDFTERIDAAKDTKILLKIWEEMKAKSFLNYNVDIKRQDQYIEELNALTLAEQKQHLIEILDKNQLYVNLSSLNDEDFKVSDNEKKVTEDFYRQ